jgi:GNAT superfamily N-acetyltransferase
LESVDFDIDWAVSYENLEIKEFKSTDPENTGHFLLECAKECSDLGLSRTHFLVDKDTNKLIGYITLAATKILTYKRTGPRLDSSAPEDKKDHFQVIKIDRIAVDKEMQKRGFGKWMLNHWARVIEVIIEPRIGCRFIVAEAYNVENDESIKLFKSCGFKEIPEKWMKQKDRLPRSRTRILMYLDLHAKAS